MKKGLHKSQSFVIERLWRSEVRKAPYNPRVIDPNARKKLQTKLKKMGLVEPLVMNKRTGNVVSGHQRLSILDDLADGAEDYQLDWSVIDVDSKQERELNVFLNNSNTQGVYDLDKLAIMLPGLELEATGFDEMDLRLSLGEDRLAALFPDQQGDMFSTENQPQPVKDAVSELARIQEIKLKKKKNREQAQLADDGEFCAIVVFQNRDELNGFLRKIGAPEDDRYVDGKRLYDALGIERPTADSGPVAETAPVAVAGTVEEPEPVYQRGQAL